MILYFDTSSLIKLYLDEEGSDVVRTSVGRARDVAISMVGYAEVRAGLARGRQAGRLNAVLYSEALRAFDERWSAISVVEITEPLVRSAGDLAERHVLRGFDAIHLASALAFQESIGEQVTFSAWDDRLLAAAQVEGLIVVPKTA